MSSPLAPLRLPTLLLDRRAGQLLSCACTCLLAQGAAGGLSVLDIATAGLYRPRTPETRAAYEALRALIQGGGS